MSTQRPIPELPPFTPRLEGFRIEEFHHQSLALLNFPIEHDQAALDVAAFRVDPPAPPPEPPIPYLQSVWYPKPIRGVRDWALGQLIPPRSPQIIGKTRTADVQRAIRPLVGNKGPVIIQGEPGMGKTTLLAHIAGHERTRQRYRRIWWFDDPQRVTQGLALALNLPTVLTESDVTTKCAMLNAALDENTLVVVDNVHPDDLEWLTTLSIQLLVGVEMTPDEPTDSEDAPPEPENVITLRALPQPDALELLAEVCGIDKDGMRGQMRAWMTHITRLLGGHPLALMIAGALFREDGLPMERLVALFSDRIVPETPNPQVALDLTIDALSSEYNDLLLAMGTLPPSGASFEAILATAKIEGVIAGYRGLAFLAKRGLIHHDTRIGEKYVAHPMVWERMANATPHKAGNPFGDRLRNWVTSLARRHSQDAVQLYRAQSEILYTLDMAKTYRLDEVANKLNTSLAAYFREYAPEYFSDDLATPALIGDRAKAAAVLTRGIALLNDNKLDEAAETLKEAYKLAENHGSDHELAEVLVALARYADALNDIPAAIQWLEKAGKLTYELKAENSLDIIRMGLAIVYRKAGRLKEALAVLDEVEGSAAERARIHRTAKQWDLMIQAMEEAGDLSPYSRADGYLQAGRYAEALGAIADEHDSRSAYLRAVIYHLNGDLETAIRGYETALEMFPSRDQYRVEALIGMGISYVQQDNREQGEKTFIQALDNIPTLRKPNPLLHGKTLMLLGALRLLDEDFNKAIEYSNQALEILGKASAESVHRESADAYRTLGRAYWRKNNKTQALTAFQNEAEHVQSMVVRDDKRIGIALHHLAEAYYASGEVERAIGNYRRALTHLDAQTEPLSYFITQVALHKVLFDEDRFAPALEVSQAAIDHLNKRPPADVQHMGYMLCMHSRTEQKLGRAVQAETTFGKWQSVLAGRSDAIRDPKRPQLTLLALALAARSLIASRRPDEAVPLAEGAVMLGEKYYPSTPIAWSVRRDLGQAYLDLGQWDSTIKALAPLLYEDVEAESFTYALSQEYTAIAQANLNNQEVALTHLQKAYEHQPIPHEQGLLLERMCDLYLEMGNTDAAIDHCRRAIPLMDRQGFPGDAARVLTKLARTLSGTNHYADSIGVYEDALQMLRALPDADLVHTARVYISLATSHEAQGQYPQAAIAYRNAIDTLDSSRTPSHDDHRQAVTRLAAVYALMQDYDHAIELYQQAREETEKFGTPQELGTIIAAQADTLRRANRLEEALEAYEAALELQPATNFPRERAATLRGYGQALSLSDLLDDARHAWTQALEITTDAPAIEIALTYHAIGEASRRLQQYEEAEKNLRDALSYHQAGNEATADTLRMLGGTLLDANRPADAISPLQQALDIEKGLPQQVNARIVTTLDLLAQAQENGGDLTGTITSHHQALVYTDRTLQPVQTANRLRTLGRLYTVLQRWRDAHMALEEALDVEFKHKPRSDSRIAQTLEMIAQAYRREGHLEKAADAYKRMASYANLTKTASAELKVTLDEIQKHRATLDAARESLTVMERTKGGDYRDLVYIYALIAQTHAALSQPESANDAIDKLLTVLEQQAGELNTADERPHYRGLAHVFEGSQAASEGNLIEARAHFQRALHDTTDKAMRWVIERGLESVQE
ncbi:MAG: hypothetical protein DPW16_15805 [Chloroflexi bacterium]|nr:hypothetical protein [Chloroflexota bacterium]